MSQKPAFTPAAGHHWLTPFYDLGVAALTREKAWRAALVEQLDPQDSDTIVDIGCGTGSLLLRIGKVARSARLTGIDPDPDVMRRARTRFAAAGLSVELHTGFARQVSELTVGERPTKIVSSLVFHQVPMDEKEAAFASIFNALPVAASFISPITAFSAHASCARFSGVSSRTSMGAPTPSRMPAAFCQT